ncbi:MAG TPA: hypothetical protein VM142_01605, partial [Acidimicrobiales bacterium]|nr:hypothetical protein [Acidimicrobiales bacterium]
GGGQLPGSVEVSNFPSPQVVGGAVSLLTTEFPWSAGDRARVDAVLAAIDTLEALTTDLRTEARRRPTYRLDSTSASVTTGAFVTVHTVTPAVATVVTGYNCDLNATGAFNYRQRLITGTDAAPTIATAEQLSTADNSWTQVALSVPAGTRIAVQVSHGEVTPQEFRASLAYYEEP